MSHESSASRQHGLENIITANGMILRKYESDSLTFDERKAVFAAEKAMNGAA